MPPRSRKPAPASPKSSKPESKPDPNSKPDPKSKPDAARSRQDDMASRGDGVHDARRLLGPADEWPITQHGSPPIDLGGKTGADLVREGRRELGLED